MDVELIDVARITLLCANLSLLFCHLAQPFSFHFTRIHWIPFWQIAVRAVSSVSTYPLSLIHWSMFICAFWPPESDTCSIFHELLLRMFGFSLPFSWKSCWCWCWLCCCCCCLLWLLFATIETCVNRILTSIMLISSRVRKANGYLIAMSVYCVCM